MFSVPIPEPELNRFSRRIRTALLDIVDALAPMDINCNYKCIFLRIVDNANHGTRNPEANCLACMHITANIIYILKFILSLITQCIMVVDGDDAHRSADLVGYFLLGRAQSRRLSIWWAGLDSNQRIPKEIDLQSTPFNHLGTDPYKDIIVYFVNFSKKTHGISKYFD